jgi:hypothetical protein
VVFSYLKKGVVVVIQVERRRRGAFCSGRWFKREAFVVSFRNLSRCRFYFLKRGTQVQLLLGENE